MSLRVIFLVIFYFQCSYGFPGGGGTTACLNLMPSHGAPPQSSEPPVSITLSTQSISPGQILTLTVSSTQAQTFFRGIMIQARTLEDNHRVIGQFFETPEIRAVNCNPLNSVATHRSNEDRSSFDLTWQAPSSFQGLPSVFHFQ